MKSILFTFVTALFVLGMTSCSENPPENKSLPILGAELVEREEAGKIVQDTVYRSIPEFSFMDQEGQVVTKDLVKDKVYIADFFFTSCPTICPKMKVQMTRIHDMYKENDEVLLISHTIDPKRDTVELLKAYAEKMGIESSKWHLLTGDRDEIYDLAEAYMVSALEDPKAPGGFVHSGAFILMDKQGRIRGYYDGTDPEAVDLLMSDMKLLLK